MDSINGSSRSLASDVSSPLKRIDPVDGNACTFSEIEKRYDAMFSDRASDSFKKIGIKAFWYTLVIAEGMPIDAPCVGSDHLVVVIDDAKMKQNHLQKSKSCPNAAALIRKEIRKHTHHVHTGYHPDSIDTSNLSISDETPLPSPTGLVKLTSTNNINMKLSFLECGDLLFVHAPSDSGNAEFQQAIQKSGDAALDWLEGQGIQVKERISVYHVAMVVGLGGNLVVEAVSAKGVSVQDFDDFFACNITSGARFFHGKVLASGQQKYDAVRNARAKIGCKYADAFRSWTEADKFYCSSLIEYAYSTATGQDMFFLDGKEYTFQFEPMEFWKKYYQDKGKEMPSGTGTSPTLLLHSNKVQVNEIIIPTGGDAGSPLPPMVLAGGLLRGISNTSIDWGDVLGQ